MVKILEYSSEMRDGLFCLFQEWDRNAGFSRDVFNESLEFLKYFDGAVFVAVENDEIVGYVQLQKVLQIGFLPFYEVVQLLVKEDLRGTGIGRSLMLKAEEHASGKGANCVKLSSQLHRSRTHVFYENLGYELEKVSKFYKKKISN